MLKSNVPSSAIFPLLGNPVESAAARLDPAGKQVACRRLVSIYLRNSEGLLLQLIYHSHLGQDDRPPSDDDPILSRVEIDYGLGYHNPHEAVIFYRTLVRTSVRFDYDTSGRLTGGFRQGPWSSYFLVTSGACEAVPERLFVILLAAHSGPWYPFDGNSRRGPRWIEGLEGLLFTLLRQCVLSGHLLRLHFGEGKMALLLPIHPLANRKPQLLARPPLHTQPEDLGLVRQ
jgi:hypothetical protein